MNFKPTTVLGLILVSLVSASSDAGVVAGLPEPELNASSWIMIEVWPAVSDVTLSAYFLDFSSEKNRSLCHATMRVFDRDQEARAKAANTKYSSYRLCLPVPEACSHGYFRRSL